MKERPHVAAIRFAILTEDELKAMAVTEITESRLYDHGEPT